MTRHERQKRRRREKRAAKAASDIGDFAVKFKAETDAWATVQRDPTAYDNLRSDAMERARDLKAAYMRLRDRVEIEIGDQMIEARLDGLTRFAPETRIYTPTTDHEPIAWRHTNPFAIDFPPACGDKVEGVEVLLPWGRHLSSHEVKWGSDPGEVIIFDERPGAVLRFDYDETAGSLMLHRIDIEFPYFL